MVTIKKQLISSTAMTNPGTNGKRTITIHETANTSTGANAQAHANLQARLWESASWHFTVDDQHAIQSYTLDRICRHAGDGAYGEGNKNSIAIEVCINSDGNNDKARRNAAELVATLLKQGVAGGRIGNVVQHNKWSGKNCPTIMRSNNGKYWAQFLHYVKQAMGDNSTVNPVKPPAPNKTVQQLAKEVFAGKHGNGEARRKSLGARYDEVQAEVNRQLTKQPRTGKSTTQLAREVLAGKHGNGQARRKALGNRYNEVQAEVNRILYG